MATQNFAVLDIGSNGVRFQWGSPGDVHSRRFPIRLGAETFGNGRISNETAGRLSEVISDFAKHIRRNKVERYRIIGTSALREASNGTEVVKRILRETRLKVDIIDAEEEARLMEIAISPHVDLTSKQGLLLDLGGGSGEYLVFDKGVRVDFFTLDLGSLRLMQDCKKSEEGVDRNSLIRLIDSRLSQLTAYEKHFAVNPKKKVFAATGGNPRALGKLAKRHGFEESSCKVRICSLHALTKILFAMTYKERAEKLKLRPDRADVILPAALVLLTTMELLNFDEILIPPVGLKDGIMADICGSGPI